MQTTNDLLAEIGLAIYDKANEARLGEASLREKGDHITARAAHAVAAALVELSNTVDRKVREAAGPEETLNGGSLQRVGRRCGLAGQITNNQKPKTP